MALTKKLLLNTIEKYLNFNGIYTIPASK